MPSPTIAPNNRKLKHGSCFIMAAISGGATTASTEGRIPNHASLHRSCRSVRHRRCNGHLHSSGFCPGTPPPTRPRVADDSGPSPATTISHARCRGRGQRPATSSSPRGAATKCCSTCRSRSPLIRREQLDRQGALDITDIADTTPNVTLEGQPRHQQHAEPVHPRHRPAGSGGRLRAGCRPLSRRCLSQPTASRRAQHLRCRADRGAARSAGHALRPQHHRRRDQICDPPDPGDEPHADPTRQCRHISARFDLIGSASAPLGPALRAGVAAARLSNSGFGKNLTTGKRNYNKDVWAPRGTIEFEPSDSIFFRLSGDYTWDDSNPRGGHRLIPTQCAAPCGTAPTPAFYPMFSTPRAARRSQAKGPRVRRRFARRDRPQRLADVPHDHRLSQGRTDTPIDFDATAAVDVDVPAIYKNHQFSQELQLVVDKRPPQGRGGALLPRRQCVQRVRRASLYTGPLIRRADRRDARRCRHQDLGGVRGFHL